MNFMNQLVYSTCYPVHWLTQYLRGVKFNCIFCKQNSNSSRSVEHIIPESLGNTKQILSRGIVCDTCNNYFARKVEKPFLDSPSIVALRFHQAVPNKRGLVPPLTGVISPGIPAVAHLHLEGPVIASLAVESEAFAQLLTQKKGTLIFPMGGKAPADAPVSRFLAKAALEAMAQRLLEHPEGLKLLVEDTQLDPLRHHARRGDTREWSYHSRRIYDMNKRWSDETEADFQVVHEYDFLHTDVGEMYFVLALFGLELTINLGGPHIDGYLAWLKQHDNASPLYMGKNGGVFPI
jgi:hypothetical protein